MLNHFESTAWNNIVTDNYTVAKLLLPQYFITSSPLLPGQSEAEPAVHTKFCMETQTWIWGWKLEVWQPSWRTWAVPWKLESRARIKLQKAMSLIRISFTVLLHTFILRLIKNWLLTKPNFPFQYLQSWITLFHSSYWLCIRLEREGTSI